MNEIEAAATIVAVLPHQAYRAELANGHVCIARSAKKIAATYVPGDAVRLVFHPADLSRARIVSCSGGL
jgi:translation initiation factor IF-1